MGGRSGRRRRGAGSDSRAGPGRGLLRPTEYADFQCSVDDPPGYRNYWTAENVVDLPDEAIDKIVQRAAEFPAGPSQLFTIAWGGAVRRFGPEHSPLAGREAGLSSTRCSCGSTRATTIV